MNFGLFFLFVLLLCLFEIESKMNISQKTKNRLMHDFGSRKLFKRWLLPEGLAFPSVRYGDIGFGK
jgi:hypothetical protein